MIHKNLTPERWFSLSTMEQLANVGMDVERTIQWRDTNKEYSTNAFYRALELLDLTLTDPKNHGGRRKELLRIREAMIDYFVYDNAEFKTDDDFWHSYFYNFNYAAAIARGK